MIGPEPKHSWSDKVERAGELPTIKEWARPLPLFKLNGATDEEKREFEAEKNAELRPVAKFYVPDMEDPYYTWEGEVVERSSLKGRELPLV
ncbi:MAG: hypothetical protein IJM76_05895 [Lachnospiraceae bacterium]|nr:hypothetical protein [Lachnospiraceae bacterium]